MKKYNSNYILSGKITKKDSEILDSIKLIACENFKNKEKPFENLSHLSILVITRLLIFTLNTESMRHLFRFLL